VEKYRNPLITEGESVSLTTKMSKINLKHANNQRNIDSPSVAHGLRYFSTQGVKFKILTTSRKASG
jgi:hypothetical protein